MSVRDLNSTDTIHPKYHATCEHYGLALKLVSIRLDVALPLKVGWRRRPRSVGGWSRFWSRVVTSLLLPYG